MLYYVEERKLIWGSKSNLVVMRMSRREKRDVADERGT